MINLADTIRIINSEIQNLYGSLEHNPGESDLQDDAIYAEMDKLVAERRTLEAARKLIAKWN